MSTDAGWSPNFGRLDAEAPVRAAKRPVRILLLGDFSARAAAGALERGDALAARKPLRVDFDNLEAVLERVAPTLNLQIGEAGPPLGLSFATLDDFHPDQVYAGLEVFKKLRDLRRQLASASTFERAAAQLGGPAAVSAPISRQHRNERPRGMALPVGAKLTDFAGLVAQRPAGARGGAPRLDAMIKEIVGPFVKPTVDKGRQAALLAAMDQGLSDAMRAVLHHPDFQMLESLWRGLDFLVRRCETGVELELHLLDLSAEEFASDLGASEDLVESALYGLLVEQTAKVRDGGFSLVLGLYEFEMTPPHAELLGRMARIAKHAGALFATGLRPDVVVQAEARLPPLVTSTWKALRALPESGALALLSPRFMLRQPYGKKSDEIDSFAFEEFTRQDGLRSLLWGHPALLLAVALASPGSRVTESVDELPYYCFRDDDGEVVPLPCAERAFGTTQANQLVQRGLTAVVGLKGQPSVRLAGLRAMDGSALAPLSSPRPAQRAPVRTEVAMGAALKLPPRPPPAPAASEEASADAGSSDLGLDTTSSDTSFDTSSSDTSFDTPSSDPGTDSATSELDAALAALETPAEAPAAEDSSSTDSELDALLKSLG